MTRTVIFGGHGKVALLAAPLLAEAGHDVVSLIRNPGHAEDVRAAGAEPLVLDIEKADQEELVHALRDADNVVFSAGAGGGDAQRTRAVDHDAAVASMRAAEAAGVRRYVMVSYLGASLHHDVPEDDPFYTYAQAKAEADEALRDSGLAWTILGPGALTDEEPSGRITVDPDLSDSDAPQRGASRGNVARAIVAVLNEPGTVGRKIDFVDGDVPVAEAVRGD